MLLAVHGVTVGCVHRNNLAYMPMLRYTVGVAERYFICAYCSKKSYGLTSEGKLSGVFSFLALAYLAELVYTGWRRVAPAEQVTQ